MELEAIRGQIMINIMENGKMIKYVDKENLNGIMAVIFKENGITILEMDMEFFLMKMVIYINDNGNKIKKTVKDQYNIVMIKIIKDNLKMI